MKQGAVSQQEYDAKVTNERQLAASVAAAAATASEARVNLGYTRVLAPQDGRIGKSNFKVGDLVNPGENSLLATISATDNFTVTFNITERDYLYVAKEYVEAKAKGAEYKPQPATVVLRTVSVYSPPRLHRHGRPGHRSLHRNASRACGVPQSRRHHHAPASRQGAHRGRRGPESPACAREGHQRRAGQQDRLRGGQGRQGPSRA